ncbi:MAG: aminotransferase class I/II-fold pyridoxal phosphate-dependent enzyme [Lachnospiraceae bacterium]|nr:aminotransferase class I/II-fold pyridoxal phosphate-dependent enzyme [Lachnospiraceae bacterium]
MQAIILAAGMGKRLKEYTQNNTKCMVKVCGETLIERMLKQLEQRAFSRVILVVGYKGEELKDFVKSLDICLPIQFVENPDYDKTNNIYSLYLAKDYLCKEDTILLESDIIFEPAVLDVLLEDSRETLALVDRYESWMDGTCLKLREDDSIEAFVPGKSFDFREKNQYYKTVNIYKFAKEFSVSRYVPFLEAYSKALGNNEYYEQVLKVLAVLDNAGIYAKRLNGQKWYEIDDAQDLDIATSMFAPEEKKLTLMQGRYGGYWRYPRLLDFCYLVNPYFPPVRMQEELKAMFGELLCAYPSGMKVNSGLAAKNTGIRQEHILVGNGAAELIRSLMEKVEGKVGIIRPSFEEYGNRLSDEQRVVFEPVKPDFSYTVEDIITFFEDKDIQNLILINPDNPSGNYIESAQLYKLFDWTKQKGIRLIYDESFSDFADEEDRSMLSEDILSRYPQVYIVKSLSKSYGIPGLRLGLLASGDEEMIAFLKKDVAIWNINSFAEYFLQIYEKYAGEYVAATRRLAAEREWFMAGLSEVKGVRVIPSQANYVMIELQGTLTATELTNRLLNEHEILVKDLSSKTSGNYLRIAVRGREDNQALLEALQSQV